MLKIRLSRTGKKGQPSFRVIVQEHTASPKRGKFVEILGNYLPARDPKVFDVKMDRAEYWISVGAQPSDTVAALLKNAGMKGMEKYLEPRNKKRAKKNPSEEELAAAAPAPEAPAEQPAKEEKAETPVKEEAPAEEPAKEEKAETPVKEDAPAEEPAKEEAKAEEAKDDEKAE